ncbi:MAG TPA: efflux RND transporter periplasmic adaptor subunit [Pseudomonadales bacterium]
MRGTYITAGVIALLLVLWLLSGQIGKDEQTEHPTLAEAQRERGAEAQDSAPAQVRARVVQAVPQVREVVLRGRTENKRTVEVKAETAGRVIERPVDRGSEVAAGDLLCRIAIEDREAQLAEARAALEQARIEYEGSLRLKQQGFQSETAIAQAKARLAAAEAAVASGELDIERTTVRAPFAGVVEDVQLEVGDYVSPGGTCVTLVDRDPMLLVGRVSQQDVAKLKPGMGATGRLVDGRTVTGTLTFVGHQNDPATRTYAIEVEVDNPDNSLRSGITAAIHVPVDEVLAHKISPALFALDDEGRIGVRTIDDSRRVRYHHVEIVRDDVDGVWVTGLPEVATLITVGQEYVVEGQRVQPSFESTGELPAKVDDSRQSTPSGATGRGGSVRAEPPVAVVAKP